MPDARIDRRTAACEVDMLSTELQRLLRSYVDEKSNEITSIPDPQLMKVTLVVSVVNTLLTLSNIHLRPGNNIIDSGLVSCFLFTCNFHFHI